MRTIYIQDNWNGAALLDSFPLMKPASDGLQINEEIQVHVKGKYAGYAKITSGSIIKWQHISENIAQIVIGNNSAYLKKVLTNVFQFPNSMAPHPDYPVFFGTAKWIERHMETQNMLFQSFYEKAKTKTTKVYEDTLIDQPLLFQD